MDNKKITVVLLALLCAACLVVAGVLVSVSRRKNRIPDTAVDDIIEVLAKENIRISPELISTKEETDKVYVCDTNDYPETVARLLGGEAVADSYVTPEGEIVVLEDGKVIEFGSNFDFRYASDGKKAVFPDMEEQSDISRKLEESQRKAITTTVTSFLERGSGAFEASEKIAIETKIEKIVKYEGSYYVACTRRIDGVEITDNAVTVSYYDGVITGAEGSWCFLTYGESYSAQLSDLLNILFSVKNEIQATAENPVEITAIGRSYSFYYYGDGDSFCLIPCWKIETDKAGGFIFNALDGTLYTK